jgi:integrase
MATIIKEKNRQTGKPNGHRTIQWIDGDRNRKTVRLGKMTDKAANEIKGKVEAILQATMSQISWDRETAKWIANLQPTLHDKFAKVGLLPPRQRVESATLGPFLTSFVETQRASVKGSTLIVYGHTKRNLIGKFGEGKPLDDISPGDADEFRAWLTTSQGLAPNTVRRRCGIARQFFRAAVRKRLIAENPFAEMNEGVAVKANKSRDYFVTREEAAKVLAECPDNEWKLIFALSRYGALRCPSEHLALTWGDVDWENSRITVKSPKTEHHEGKESRIIPLFPELREYLETAFNDAPEGTVHVIRLARNANHRTRLEKIIKRAKLAPWPKLFQNLRATRATELAADFPAHVAAEWTGHSQKVAAEHYWRVTDADFEKALHKALQHPAVSREMEGNHACENPGNSAEIAERELELVGDEGLEPPTSTL